MLAFSIGVSTPYGPGEWIYHHVQQGIPGASLSGYNDPTIVRSFERNEEGVFMGDDGASRVNMEEIQQQRIKYKKRHPTKHIADLGELVDPEPDQEEYFPSGQHLLVDLKNVEYDFLNSEDRLAQAMVNVVRDSKLTLLSYHCHTLQPAGVSCVGVLLESHISFHTWPEEGVITLDLFTCGSNPLIPVIPVIMRLFGIPRSEGDEVISKWGHELRGFRTAQERKKNPLDSSSDLANWITGPMNLGHKEEIVSVQSPHQHIAIWDAKDEDETPSYADIVKYGLQQGDPRLLTNELTTPSRFLFLDGKLQSDNLAEREFHEALVHPAMFTHPNPRTVAIIGGGEGAALREVLKHKTVESVTNIEIDEMVVELCKEHIKTMSDCSSIVGSTDSCFDDPRTTMIYMDGVKYMTENKPKSSYDVVIIDALDVEDEVALSKEMDKSEEMISALFDSLSEDGVLAIEVGIAPNIHEPSPLRGANRNREILFNLIEKKAKAMFVYEDTHTVHNEPYSFLVACKSSSCRKLWYASVSAVDYQIYERIPKTKKGEVGLIHYDGATHSLYQYAPKAWETIYCRREPMPLECNYRGLDFSTKIYEYEEDSEDSAFSIVEEDDGTSKVFANVMIEEGSYILPSHLAASFVISDTSIEALNDTARQAKEGDPTPTVVIDNMLEFVKGHSHGSILEGADENIVEIGATLLIREANEIENANVGKMMPFPKEGIPPYSPVFERRRRSFDVFLVATRTINAGEELLKPANLWD